MKKIDRINYNTIFSIGSHANDIYLWIIKISMDSRIIAAKIFLWEISNLFTLSNHARHAWYTRRYGDSLEPMEKRLNGMIASHLLDLPLETFDAVNVIISLDSHLLSCVSEKIANSSVCALTIGATQSTWLSDNDSSLHFLSHNPTI